MESVAIDRDIALVLEVVREVHGGHAAGAEFADNAIAVGEGGGETMQVSHVGSPSSTREE